MRVPFGVTLVFLVYAAAPGSREIAGQSFEFAFLGDNPYGSASVARFESLIEDVNGRDGIQWVIHVGDVKAGADSCSDEFLQGRFDLYQRFDVPFVLTPGDNDWFDCGQEGAGGYDVYERLDYLRRLFFPIPGQTTGGRPMAVRTQASERSFGEFVENVMWTREDVVFSTLHLVRTTPPPPDPAVAERRMDAALQWIHQTFKLARELGSPAVFMAMQADPWMAWGLPLVLGVVCPQCLLPSAGLDRLYPVLVEESLAFGRPVVLAVGDTHVFRVDKPLYDPETEQSVENFTRVETFGSPLVHWVRVVVDPGEPQVFTFHQQIVTANTGGPPGP